ncbi:MAG: NRDE family protein [Desulfobacterales bacterium]
MCLILFAYDTLPGYRLIMAANRDEFYVRPTMPLAAWADAREVYGGRDIKEGGTWLGVSRTGRLAALTNYRDPARQLSQAPSRGLLTSRFLTGDDPPAAYLEQVVQTAGRYNGFNLLTGDKTGLWYFSNRGRDPARLPPGLYGVSNHLIDTPWPKVTRGKQQLKALLERGAGWDVADLFALLADRAVAPDGELPDTGVGLAWERTLAPLFITSPNYGTRASTVLLIDTSGTVTFAERTFKAENPSREARPNARCEIFKISPWPSAVASDPAAP